MIFELVQDMIVLNHYVKVHKNRMKNKGDRRTGNYYYYTHNYCNTIPALVPSGKNKNHQFEEGAKAYIFKEIQCKVFETIEKGQSWGQKSLMLKKKDFLTKIKNRHF